MHDKAADKYATEGISDTPWLLRQRSNTKLETRLCNCVEAIFLRHMSDINNAVGYNNKPVILHSFWACNRYYNSKERILSYGNFQR